MTPIAQITKEKKQDKLVFINILKCSVSKEKSRK